MTIVIHYNVIMRFCKHVSKVILVPCSVLQLKQDNAGQGEATINNAANVPIFALDIFITIYFQQPCNIRLVVERFLRRGIINFG